MRNTSLFSCLSLVFLCVSCSIDPSIKHDSSIYDPFTEYVSGMDYLGSTFKDFNRLTTNYNFCREVLQLHYKKNWSYSTGFWDPTIYSFPYTDKVVYGIGATNNRIIEEVIEVPLKRLTWSEAMKEGYIGKRVTKTVIYEEMYTHTQGVSARCDFTCYETENTFDFGLENIIKLGPSDAIFIFHASDHWAHGEIKTGLYLNGLSGFPLYDDDLKEILGVLTLTDSGRFMTFTKEDGYDIPFSFKGFREKIIECYNEDKQIDRFGYYLTYDDFVPGWWFNDEIITALRFHGTNVEPF